MSDPAKLKEVTVSIPFLGIAAKWEADLTQRQAAWSLYVELVTRVSVQPLKDDQGLVREAMNSLYSLFGTTREILKAAGPNVGASKKSVGGIAILVLNNALRPFLAKWHPLLQAWEASRPAGVSPKEHEVKWDKETLLRQELKDLRDGLEQYANALAEIAGVEED